MALAIDFVACGTTCTSKSIAQEIDRHVKEINAVIG